MSVNDLTTPITQPAPLWTNLNVNSIKTNSIIGGGSVLCGTEGPITQDVSPKTTSIAFSSAFPTPPKVSLSLKDVSDSAAVPCSYFSNVTTTGFDATVDFGAYTPGRTFRQLTTSSQTVSEFISMAKIGGKPAIAYQEVGRERLMFIIAKSHTGSAWFPPVVVDESVASTGGYPSLCEINGFPAISYVNFTDDDVMYIRANDAEGTSWGTPVVLFNNAGEETSLVEVNGRPAVAFSAASNVNYVRALDSTGATWGSVIQPYSTPDSVGDDLWMAIVQGHPAIAFEDSTNKDVLYIRADDADGTTWGAPVIAHNDTVTVDANTLVVVDGNPAISFMKGNTVRYVRATDSTGTAWGASIQVSGFTNPDVPRMAIIDGNPAISALDSTNTTVEYIRATDSTGSAWGSVSVIANYGYATDTQSLIEIDGQPAVAYNDSGDETLFFSNNYVDITYSIDYIATE